MVRGLTTAAGLWVTAAIGLACGTGMYIAAAVATTMVLLGLEVLNALIPKIGTTVVILTFTATSKESIRTILDLIKKDSLELYSYELKSHRTSQGDIFEAKIEIKVKRNNNKHFIDYLNKFEDVTLLSIE